MPIGGIPEDDLFHTSVHKNHNTADLHNIVKSLPPKLLDYVAKNRKAFDEEQGVIVIEKSGSSISKVLTCKNAFG